MTTANNSSTGGYLLPAPQGSLPGGLTFSQFLQQVFVGISGLDGTLVRPRWQPKPLKSPDLDVNWMAFAVVDNDADAHAFSGVNPDGSNYTQRHEDLEVQCAFYGTDAMRYATQVRDGFQVQQNLDVLRSASMGFVRTGKAISVPDLIDEIWRNRVEMSVFLRREVLRSYPILTMVSASGTIESIVSGNLKTLAWNANPPES